MGRRKLFGSFSSWCHQGEQWIWMNALAIAVCIVMVVGLILLVMIRGLGYFWPADLVKYQYLNQDARQIVVVGEMVASEYLPQQDRERIKVKIGNRDLYGLDFRWMWKDQIISSTRPPELIAIEREEWGNFYGYFDSMVDGKGNPRDGDYQTFIDTLPEIHNRRGEIADLIHNEISSINGQIEKLRLARRGYVLDNNLTAAIDESLTEREQQLRARYRDAESKVVMLEQQFANLGGVQMVSGDGQKKIIQLKHIYTVWQPNTMTLLDKVLRYSGNLWRFLRDDPREANTEGGIFPAIFGTVVMVLLMTIFTTPMGVVAAIYIREYARQGRVIRLVRICVNNLAGVPSVVYGVFGLGFFVYFLGGNIDNLFYRESLPSPTFGSPGLLWASLTLALLTLPVVIVSAEEGFARIPVSVREGSMALGATRFETIYKVLLPMSTPAIMTGIILAIARAAGEVAPLMLVGVVKLAPDLVIDSTSPFVHLDRKFMHLGFHIYDVGFQSPNVDAATPLVYATAFLLLLVILVLNLTAILIRNRLREKYKLLDI